MKNFSVKTTGAGISGCPPRMLSDIGPMICSNLGERVADHAALAVASDDQRISFRGPQRIHHRIRRIFFDIGFGTFAFRIDEIFLRMASPPQGLMRSTRISYSFIKDTPCVKFQRELTLDLCRFCGPFGFIWPSCIGILARLGEKCQWQKEET